MEAQGKQLWNKEASFLQTTKGEKLCADLVKMKKERLELEDQQALQLKLVEKINTLGQWGKSFREKYFSLVHQLAGDCPKQISQELEKSYLFMKQILLPQIVVNQQETIKQLHQAGEVMPICLTPELIKELWV